MSAVATVSRAFVSGGGPFPAHAGCPITGTAEFTYGGVAGFVWQQMDQQIHVIDHWVNDERVLARYEIGDMCPHELGFFHAVRR